MQIAFREKQRRHQIRQNVHGCTPVSVPHQRQIDQAFDRSRREQLLHPIVFPTHVLIRRVPRAFKPDAVQIGEADFDGVAGAVQCRVERHAQARDRSPFAQACGAPEQRREPFLGGGKLADQKFTFGATEIDIEGELTLAFPTVVRQQRMARYKIHQRRRIGGRSSCPPASLEIEPGRAVLLLRRSDQGGAAVELGGDLKDLVIPLFRRQT